MMADQDQCCTLPPFTSSYEPVGKKITITVDGKDDMSIYLTGPSSSSSTKALVAIYGTLNPTPTVVLSF
jgi:hypothetical protein